MVICALISTYKEEELLGSVLASAQAMDYVLVFDGPIGKENDTWKHTTYDTTHPSYMCWEGEWVSDASKRTIMLNIAKAITSDEEDVWGLMLDGDELLIWGEYLHDHCRRADQETGVGGTTIKIVEYDGSVFDCYGKLFKLDSIAKFLLSSYQVETPAGMILALPNVPICTAGGIPAEQITERDDPRLGLLRPPLQGEPHLLHRHGLRDKEREVPRLHDLEAESFDQLVEDAGLGKVNQTAEERN